MIALPLCVYTQFEALALHEKDAHRDISAFHLFYLYKAFEDLHFFSHSHE